MKNLKAPFQVYIPVILISMIVTLATSSCITLLKNQNTTQIMTVHLSEMINHYVQSLVQAKVPSQQLKHQMQIFSKNLDDALKILAHQHHAIILVSEAVAAGQQDITVDLEKIMQKRQQNHGL